jgi:hypothetical protein
MQIRHVFQIAKRVRLIQQSYYENVKGNVTSTKQSPCMRHSRSFSLCETHCQRLRVLV